MKIQQVKIKHFKVVEDFEYDFQGANVLLVGDNGVGKSSVMQMIEIALGKNTNIPPNATGEGEVIADKDGNKYTFTVKFKDGKPLVTVTAPNGLRDNRKSAVAALVGAIDFDIDEFVKLSDSVAGRKKQVEIYKSLLPADLVEEISKLEVSTQAYYDDRTEINRKAKTLEGFIKESPLFGKDLDVTPTDVSALNEQIQKANAFNEKITGVAARVEERKRKAAANAERIEILKKEILALTEENDGLLNDNTAAEKWLSENQRIDTTDLYNQVNEAAESNRTVELARQQREKIKLLEDLQNQAGEMTALIESNRQAISDAIKDMAVPVEGLSFDADQLIYNGVPVSTASLANSEIMHLGAKMKIAQNHNFGVLLLERTESIGAARWKEILAMAKQHDWQIIGEKVERGTQELKIEFINE